MALIEAEEKRSIIHCIRLHRSKRNMDHRIYTRVYEIAVVADVDEIQKMQR